MVSPELLTLAAALAGGVAALAALGEWLHGRRVRRLSPLAFGPGAGARAWTALAPVLRIAALAACVWSLVILTGFEGRSRARDEKAAATRHLVVLLDVSPSMQLADAGARHAQRRSLRAGEVLQSVLDRSVGDSVKTTMACFYNDVLPLVEQCGDREVIRNFTDNLPLHIAFRPGKTDLVRALNKAGDLVKDLPRKSATLLVLTDGDTVPDAGLKPLPSAVNTVIFAGLGEVGRGTFLDGHLSRQDHATLSRLARRMGGHYHDANVKHVPSELLKDLTAPDPRRDRFRIDLRTLALLLLGAGTLVLCGLPVLLEYFGSPWRPAAASPAPERTSTAEYRHREEIPT